MKIYIATDSRGYRKKNKSTWVDFFCQNYKAVVRGYHAGKLGLLTSLYDIHNDLKSNKDNYDLIILQTGIHELCVAWPEKIWKNIIPDYNPTFLIKHNDKFFYSHKEELYKIILSIKEHGKYLMLLGMHSWLYGTGQKIWKGYCFHEKVLEMNQFLYEISNQFSKIDCFYFPMDLNWIKKNTYDKVHYSNTGHSHIIKYIERHISRIDKTIVTAIKKYDKHYYIGNKKICNLYKSAETAGRKIAKLTKKGDKVLISKQTSREQIEIFLGCILFGRIPCFVSCPSIKVSKNEFEKKIDSIYKTCDPKLCICDRDDLTLFKKYLNSMFSLPDEESNEEINISDSSDVAFIQLSSGTTGLPKILSISHKTCLVQCEEYANFIHFNSNDVIVSWLPLYHDMGLIACFLMPLIINSSFVHINPFQWLAKPKEFFNLIKQSGGTFVWLPNFAFSLLNQRVTPDNVDLSSLKAIINCSELTMYDNMIDFYEQFKLCGLKKSSLQICYALAENIFAVSHSNVLKTDLHNNILSCGKTLPGTSVIIVKNGKDITGNGIGEVYISSSYMAKEIDRSFFGYYPTGDLGFFKEGELYICGRMDDMIVLYGENISPYPIEKYIGNLKEIVNGRVACFGFFNRFKATSDVIVCVEVHDNLLIDNNSLKIKIINYVKNEFGISCIPFIVPKMWIIKTSSGKINRKKTKTKWIKENLSNH